MEVKGRLRHGVHKLSRGPVTAVLREEPVHTGPVKVIVQTRLHGHKMKHCKRLVGRYDPLLAVGILLPHRKVSVRRKVLGDLILQRQLSLLNKLHHSRHGLDLRHGKHQIFLIRADRLGLSCVRKAAHVAVQ